MRIISLIASATEIICALGSGDKLVGRSHECDNPQWVRSLPQLSRPAFDVTISSAEIDAEVRRRLHAREPLYEIDADRIRELKPDVVFAQSHCEVCAVTPGDVERSRCGIPGARVVGLSAGTVAEVFDGILQIARTLDLESEGHRLIRQESDRLDRVRMAASSFSRPSVVVLEWTDPIFPMGNWGPELVDAAGGELVLGNRGQHSSAVPTDLLRSADPEYIIIAPCGFSLQRSVLERPVVERYAWWADLRTVREHKVAFADGNLFFNRSGMTVVDTAEIIAEILHGIPLGERREGSHWVWAE